MGGTHALSGKLSTSIVRMQQGMVRTRSFLMVIFRLAGCRGCSLPPLVGPRALPPRPPLPRPRTGTANTLAPVFWVPDFAPPSGMPLFAASAVCRAAQMQE